MVGAVGVGEVKDADLTPTDGSVAGAKSFLTAVDLFHSICPHEIKNCSSVGNHHWVAKHVLKLVLVKLKELGLLPFIPVGAFKEDSTSEFRCTCQVLKDTAVPTFADPVGDEGCGVVRHKEMPRVHLVQRELWNPFVREAIPYIG